MFCDHLVRVGVGFGMDIRVGLVLDRMDMGCRLSGGTGGSRLGLFRGHNSGDVT